MRTLIILLALVALVILAWKLWKPIVQPPKQEVPKNEARLYFFYTDWCGFSQKALPEWEKLEQTLSKGGYFGRTHVTPIKVDAEQDRKTATLYGINAYPTVVLETSEASYDFDKRVTYANLMAFLRRHLGQETESL
jgi:thiol-disulfide isomerase/thioredoxin